MTLRRRRRGRALIVVAMVLLTLSCRSQSNPTANENATTNTVVSSTPPFQTKEPDRYRAIRNVTVLAANGQTITTKNLVARDRDLRRAESQVASKTIAYLERPEGKFVLLPDEKVYAEVTPDTSLPTDQDPETLERSPEGLLHADVGNTSYEKLGKEAIGQRSTDKYRVVVNAPSAGNVSVSETLIWIDEALGMPIKSETKSADGTRVLVELSNISVDVDNVLFQIPKDYQKVTFIEFRKRLL
jgi:hypothetical protein